MPETVALNVQGNRAEILFNRPEVLNAANGEWIEDLHSVLDEVERRDELRTVIVSGKGTSFSSGIDLKALSIGEIQIGWFRRWEEAMRRLELMQPVTIARIQGYALGGGLQVALACDLRVAADNAKLGLPAVLEALIPGTGTWRLPRFIGLGRARRMILTGELLPAAEALAIGLVDWVVPVAELESRTAQIAQELLMGSRTAQYLSKKLAAMSFETGFNSFCETYLDYQSQALESQDHRRARDEYLARQFK